MTRDDIKAEILRTFRDHFEIDNPGLEVNLREAYDFDSIDAIELLREIEIMLDSELTQEEKKQAMEIQTINDILDYIESLMIDRRRADR